MLTIQTKEEFDTIIDKIRVNVELYEKCLTEVQYKIFLANKKVIDINYDKECIPHILGIDMDFLRNLNISIEDIKTKYSSFVDNIFATGNCDRYLLSTPFSIVDIIS